MDVHDSMKSQKDSLSWLPTFLRIMHLPHLTMVSHRARLSFSIQILQSPPHLVDLS